MKYIYVAMIAIILTVSAMIFVNASAGDIEILNNEITRKKIQLDSILNINKLLEKDSYELNKRILILIDENGVLKNGVLKKEEDTKKSKDDKNKNPDIIFSASDSTIIDILTKHQFKANKKG
jgi:hypothetical protein